jgi:hypothetical protein
LTSSESIGVLPTRSPMPSAAACTRVAPASSAARLLIDGEIAVAMAVPVDADVRARVLDDLRHEPDDGRGTGRRGVPDGVGDADPLRARADGAGVDRAQRLGVRRASYPR